MKKKKITQVFERAGWVVEIFKIQVKHNIYQLINIGSNNMKYKKSLLFICLIICLFSIASVCASEVNETLVASEDQSDELNVIEDMCAEENNIACIEENTGEFLKTSNNNDVLSSSYDNFAQLNTTLQNAESNSTINLIQNYAYVGGSIDKNYSNGIIIDKPITIDGNGHIIDGKNNARIFNIVSDNVILKNLKFKNGVFITNDEFEDSRGGAIYWKGNYGSLINCTFENCNFKTNYVFYPNQEYYLDFKGGAVYWSGNNNSIENCIFNGINLDRNLKNGICTTYGAALYLDSTNTTISSCEFLNCHSCGNGGYGGAIYTSGAVITNSKFINNNATTEGGSIYSIGDDDLISSCIFEENAAPSGGVIYCKGKKCTILNSNFTKNRASYNCVVYGEQNGVIFNSTFKNNIANFSEVFFKKSINVKNTTALSNDEFSILINTGGNFIDVSNDYNLNKPISIFKNNICIDFHGKNVYSTKNIPLFLIFAQNVTIKNVNISNVIINSFSIIYSYGSLNYFNNSIFNNNSGIKILTSCNAFNCSFINNKALNQGCIMQAGNAVNCSFINNKIYAGTLYGGSAFNCTFDNNYASTYGGAIYAGYASNCIFNNNGAGFNGGAICTGTATNCIFNKNYADKAGGATASCNVYNSTFTNNQVRSTDSKGGAVAASNNIISNCIFNNNYQNNNVQQGSSNVVGGTGGGGVYAYKSNIINCKFDSNYAISYGGAILLENSNMTNCTLTNNHAEKDGGAVFVAGLDSTSIINESTFIKNGKTGNIISNHEGNAISTVKSFQVFNSVFINNTARSSWATLFGDDISVTNCEFKNNDGWDINVLQNGKIYNSTFFNTETGSIVGKNVYIFGCEFNNSANVNIHVSSGKFYNSTFFNTGTGSSILFDNYAFAQNIIQNCKFFKYNLDNAEFILCSGDIDITNSTFFTIIPSILSINVTDIEYNQKAIINISIPHEYLEGNVSIKIYNNEDYEKIFTQKAEYMIIKELKDLNVSNYQIDVIYTDLKNNYTSESHSSFNVNKITPNIQVTLEEKEYGIESSINIDVPEITGILTIDVGENISYSEVITGKEVIVKKISNLDVGKYNITVNYMGNKFYHSFKQELILNIVKAPSTFNISANNVDYGQNTIIHIDSNLEGDVIIKVNKTTKNTHLLPNNDKYIDFGILDPGQYFVNVIFTPKDNNYQNSNKNVTFEVYKINITNINIPSDINGLNSFQLSLPIDADGIVILSINNKNYTFQVTNGETIIDIPKLNDGDYNYTITYSQDSRYASFSKTGNLTIKNILQTRIIASGVNTFYNGGGYLIATLKDINGKPIVGVQVTINLNGVKYQTTDKNGQVKLSTNGLAPKTYTATITFAGNANYAKSTKSVKVTVKKATPKLTAGAKTFKKSVKTKKYTVTLKTNQNKVMKNTKVYLKVNKKTYTAKTNSKGVATFKITKLTKKGKYTAAVTYSGSSYYNKVTKNVKITIK